MSDGAKDSHTLKIDWGDGKTESVKLAAGKTSFDIGHDYGRPMPGVPQPNAYTVQVTATDDEGASFTTSTVLERKAPKLSIPSEVFIQADLSATLQGTVASADGTPENFTLALDWGDGATETVFVANGASAFSSRHVYPAIGPREYEVKVTAFGARNLITWGDGPREVVPIAAGQTTYSVTHTFADSRPAEQMLWFGYHVPIILNTSDGRSDVDSVNVTVANTAPTATLQAPSTAVAGEPFEVKLINPSDPSGADTAAGFKYAFDCGGGYSAASPANRATCTPSAAGALVVRAKMHDQDLAATVYSATVQVSGGTTVELCRDAYFAYCQVVSGAVPALSSLGLDNWASSIRISGPARITVYTDDNYGGVCQTFTASNSWLGASPIGNDSISSMRVGGACP
jgi:hypothetical protein